MSSLPQAVLIDLDDTILDDSSCVDACWADACADADVALDVALVRKAIREHADRWWSDPTRHRQGRLDLRAASRTIVSEVFLAEGWGDEVAAASISDRYRDLREERVCPFPGALELLGRLRTAGVRLGLMTNGAAAAQRAKIERFSLAGYFDHIVIEGELGVGKPDRLVFETLLRELRVQPGAAWAVGDNLEFDVLAPMDLGIFGVWLDLQRSGCNGDRQPDRIIPAIADLLG